MSRTGRKVRRARPTGRPVKIQAVLDHHSVVVRNGMELSAPNMVISPEDFGRMKAGYVCFNCLEDLDTAFPDNCPICNYPMRDRQSHDLSNHYEGEFRLGPTTSLIEEKEIMAELNRKERRDKGEIWTPSIQVPRSI